MTRDNAGARLRYRLPPAKAPVVVLVIVTATILVGIGGIPRGYASERASLAALPVGVNISLGGGPFGIAYDSVNSYLYVDTPNCCSANVSVVNPTTNQVVASILLPTYSIGPIAADVSTGMVYVGDIGSTVYAIDPFTDRIRGTVPLLSGCPNGCAPDVQVYDPANGDVYITSVITNNVSVIHGSSFVTSIPAGAGPNGAAYDSANGNIYVSNEGSCLSCINLTVINGTSNHVVGQVSGSGGGPGVTYDSSNGDLYTCTNGNQAGDSNFVSVANGSTDSVVATIPIASSCGRDVYDPANNYVFVTDRSRPGGAPLSNVTLIDPNTNRIVLTQPVGLGPVPIAYDPANRNVYVGNAISDSITVLPQIFRLTVHETGLPKGTTWSVMMNGTTFSSTTSTISFPETNGTFDYSVPRVLVSISSDGHTTNYTATPSRGTVSMAGGPQVLNVSFSNRTGGGGSSPGLFGLPGQTGYYVLGGSLALILAVAIFVLTRRKRQATQAPGPPAADDSTFQNQ